MTPGLCGGVDGLAMFELFSGSLGICVGGLVKGNGISLLMGHVLSDAPIFSALFFHVV